MKRNEPNEFSLFEDKASGSVFVGETPEDVIKSAVYCNSMSADERLIMIPSAGQIGRVDRLIMGGVSNDNEFNKAVAIGRDGKADKEAIEAFYGGIGFPGSNVKQRVLLAHNAEVLVDAQHDTGFRNFAKRVYQHDEKKILDRFFGRDGLFIASLGSGIDKMLVHKPGEDSSRFYRHNTKFLYLPRGLMNGIADAGLKYRNDERQAMQ